MRFHHDIRQSQLQSDAIGTNIAQCCYLVTTSSQKFPIIHIIIVAVVSEA